MRKPDLRTVSTSALVESFIQIALAQAEAELYNNNRKFTRLFHEMEAVTSELKSREGDQRKQLLSLFEHPHAQVRLMAATSTLALAPEDARNVLRLIKKRQEFPQALDAGMRHCRRWTRGFSSRYRALSTTCCS